MLRLSWHYSSKPSILATPLTLTPILLAKSHPFVPHSQLDQDLSQAEHDLSQEATEPQQHELGQLKPSQEATQVPVLYPKPQDIDGVK